MTLSSHLTDTIALSLMRRPHPTPAKEQPGDFQQIPWASSDIRLCTLIMINSQSR